MSRFMQWFNFAGILALAVLCAFQWRMNLHLNLYVTDLENIRLRQSAKIAEQDKTIKEDAADLDDFRQRLTLSEAALKEAEAKFNTLAIERDKLVAERDQLKANLDQWIAAEKLEEESVKKANDEIQKLSNDRNDAVSKFNDLATKYNALVKDWNAAQAKNAAPH